MLDVLAPGKLVLTLQSTPPFVVESALALALTILLAAPLIVRVYFLLVRDELSSRARMSIYLRENGRLRQYKCGNGATQAVCNNFYSCSSRHFFPRRAKTK